MIIPKQPFQVQVWRSIRLCLLLTVSLLTFFYGHQNALAQTVPITLAQSLTLKVSARDKTIVAGQPVVLQFTWRNINSREITLDFGRPGMRNFEISLQSEKGEIIKPLPDLSLRVPVHHHESRNIAANQYRMRSIPVVFGPWEKIPSAGSYTIVVKPVYSGKFAGEAFFDEKQGTFRHEFRLPIVIAELDERKLRFAAEKLRTEINNPPELLTSEELYNYPGKYPIVVELFAFPEQHMMRIWRAQLNDPSNKGIGNMQAWQSYEALIRVASKRVVELISEIAWPGSNSTISYEQTFTAREQLLLIHDRINSPEAKAEVEKQFKLHEGAWKNEKPTFRL